MFVMSAPFHSSEDNMASHTASIVETHTRQPAKLMPSVSHREDILDFPPVIQNKF